MTEDREISTPIESGDRHGVRSDRQTLTDEDADERRSDFRSYLEDPE